MELGLLHNGIHFSGGENAWDVSETISVEAFLLYHGVWWSGGEAC